jgi:signal recognition particle receptor subunit alpha
MIDYFTIFNKRGIVLFSQQFSKLKGNPIDKMIRDVLIEERSGENSFTSENYAMKWTFANEFDLIFVAVYQRILSLLYIDELLEIVKKKFCELFKEVVPAGSPSAAPVAIPFEGHFSQILNEVESTSKRRPVAQKTFAQTDKGQAVRKNGGSQKSSKKKSSNESKSDDEDDDEAPKKGNGKRSPPVSPQPINENNQHNANNNVNQRATENVETVLSQDEIERKKKEFAERMMKGRKPAAKPKSPQPSAPVKGKGSKQARIWDIDSISKEEKAALNRSKKEEVPGVPAHNDTSVPLVNGEFDLSDSDGDSEEDIEEPAEPESGAKQANGAKDPKKASASSFGFLKSYFGGLTGNKVLSQEDLEPVLAKFKQHLMEKNVAAEIADKLCQSVGASLEGKKLSTFQGVSSTVKAALEEALTRILTPKRQIDILREVAAVKGQRPYTIVFCGVNGVGKSTNLAKICYWLMLNNLKVMMAACDTFRSGAVEQLRVHCDRLKVQLFERGYGKDAAGIAMDAINYAKDNKFDVVMIDTAGRMQDNEPLMRALAKLVTMNKVDLVLFVGEALVGNDGVDQLVKFNKALANLSITNPPRLIDGIILTKFDTIDDKVGAAISMVYSTGQPIVFLGTGQHYTDLKKMNVSTVIKTLLK